MNFADFQSLREKIVREETAVLDCAETNLYRTFGRLIPPFVSTALQTIHRCHLATEWTEHFHLPSALAGRALVSSGIRDSLAILFFHYARVGAKLWLPADNYPIYDELARAAGLLPLEFPTLPEPVWPSNASDGSPELLLVTNPLKPLGRWLNTSDILALESWLAVSPERRVLLDMVYTFDRPFHPSNLRLFATGQTMFCHGSSLHLLSV